MDYIIEDLKFFTQQQKRRDDEWSCGVASFMMLLKYHFNNKQLPFKKLPTYDQLCEELHNSTPAQEKRYIDKNVINEYVHDRETYGAFQEDIVKYLNRMKIPFEKTTFIPHYKDNDRAISNTKEKRLAGLLKRFIENNIPIMVEIGYPEEKDGHWLVLRGYSENDKKLLLFDPQFTVEEPDHKKPYSEKRFLKSWDGISLCITNR